MVWARNLAGLVLATMILLTGNILVNGSLDQGLGMDRFLAGLTDPWSTLIGLDLMSGLLLMAGWIAWRQRGERLLDTLAWILCLTWWGNIVAAAYILIALRQSEGDPLRFFMGARAGPLLPVWKASIALRLAALVGAAATAAFTASKIANLGLGSLPGQAYIPGFLPIVLALVLLALPSGRAPERN
jgi:hypothetical protein